MTIPFSIASVRTTCFAWAALIAAVVGWALDGAHGLLWVHAGIEAKSLEYLGHAVGWVGYGALWLLLPVSAFRPETRFYTRGDCSLRAKRFTLVLGLLVFMHVWLVAAVAYALRGAW